MAAVLKIDEEQTLPWGFNSLPSRLTSIMLAVAQPVERLTVVQVIVGSKPTGQPVKPDAGRIGIESKPVEIL
jgi:hypothetical protein